jgi:hypothetical protein
MKESCTNADRRRALRARGHSSAGNGPDKQRSGDQGIMATQASMSRTHTRRPSTGSSSL